MARVTLTLDFPELTVDQLKELVVMADEAPPIDPGVVQGSDVAALYAAGGLADVYIEIDSTLE